MCQLRNYRPGDEDSVFQMVKTVLAEYRLSANSDVTDADLKDIQLSYISKGGVFRILESEGRIVGSYGLYAMSIQSCELRKMYLLPEVRGQGLGKMMMDDAILKAKELKFTEMALETNSRLQEARELYRKYGFTEFIPDHLSDRCDLAMRKTL